MSEYVWVVTAPWAETEVFVEEIDALRAVNKAQGDASTTKVVVQAKKEDER